MDVINRIILTIWFHRHRRHRRRLHRLRCCIRRLHWLRHFRRIFTDRHIINDTIRLHRRLYSFQHLRRLHPTIHSQRRFLCSVEALEVSTAMDFLLHCHRHLWRRRLASLRRLLPITAAEVLPSFLHPMASISKVEFILKNQNNYSNILYYLIMLKYYPECFIVLSQLTLQTSI